ncbi:phage tail-collar fiber domain-containing protein [Enterobacter roggenkampii]|uniref:phage tail-collar fiber domain-containing protein n=1 Tax=Enterobacter roggenkampii TaxID=1812935 RepID=UPI00292B9581|nr:phage tail protein [Enterobacter roggenkampii]MDV0450772.1 phage tail protein [Enterobacter roggenkampii]MDV0455400.1 phage tail protein [Enterobacter roggenkampii]MDV0465043.1 phage tail protein [Enterobacter roggenkampii]MDV0469637.1 phage tail protein [Enterobacter roggenkampii]MDV0479372.1 phage tail protein [Enterobacter roggenkampii]
MTVKYKTVITKAGAIKLAAATVPNGKKVNFTAMAIGDGGGTLPVPDASQTKLVNEVWRHALNKISQDNKHQNYVIAELVIPPETGGFWMREMGLYDDTGTLIAVGNMAESYKPELAEGSGRAQTVRMVIMVSDIESVELTIDTSTVIATQDYVDDKLAEHEQSRRHRDATLTTKGFTQLSSATDSASESVAATPKAVKAAYDLANGKYTAQDATTAQKGIVQLSSATDSTSESVAATPKAVKAAYDLADGKYTAQDATTAQKGIVQLSSATDSASESLAATPKAVKTVNDDVTKLKNSLGTAAGKNVQESRDDITPGRVLVNGGALALRSVAASADRDIKDANHLPVNSVSFCYGSAAHSPGYEATILDVAGLNNDYRVQYAASYSDGGKQLKFRTYNGDNKTWGGSWTTVLTNYGGSVDYLDGARYYSTRPEFWQGCGGFAGQYTDRTAPFYVTGFTAPYGVSNYFPIVKGTTVTAGRGYGSSVSFGAYRSGNDDFGSAVVHVIGDSGQSAGYYFDAYGVFNAPSQLYSGGGIQSEWDIRSKGGSLYAVGQVSVGGNVVAGSGVFESGGNVRVYSPNNPPPRDQYAAPNTAGFNGAALWWRCGSTGKMTMAAQVGGIPNGGRVYFPTAFPNVCASVVPTRNEEPGNGAAMQPYNVDRTGFNLRVAGGGTVTLMYVAEGY